MTHFELNVSLCLHVIFLCVYYQGEPQNDLWFFWADAPKSQRGIATRPCHTDTSPVPVSVSLSMCLCQHLCLCMYQGVPPYNLWCVLSWCTQASVSHCDKASPHGHRRIEAGSLFAHASLYSSGFWLRKHCVCIHEGVMSHTCMSQVKTYEWVMWRKWMSVPHAWHDLFIFFIMPLCVLDAFGWTSTLSTICRNIIWETWLIHMSDLTHSYVWPV